MKDLKLEITYLPLEQLTPYKNNAKLHPQEQIDQIKASIKEFGMNDPIAVWGKDNIIVEGHGRLLACQQLGIESVPVIRLDNLTEDQRKAYTLAHNKLTMNSDFDLELLKTELQDIDLDMGDFGFDMEIGDIDLDDGSNEKPVYNSLNDMFIVPPFSVLDSRQGYWMARKKAWKALGIRSEEGRKENLTFSPNLEKYKYAQYGGDFKGVAPQTSVFDPVLCEIAYKWFNIDGGKIYDCFAGGSVRGIVAEKLGFKYTGIDLRQEQIDANKKNAKEIGVEPTWYCDDSLNADKYVADNSCDMVFSCPPYADLEVYSDDPRDISNMEYTDFCATYKKIIEIACRKLKQDRFAVFVVGDVRDKNGLYRNFVDYTKKCFIDSGLKLYNDIILIEPIGTAAMRASAIFKKSRKTVKTHQNVLVFYKGDPKNIKNNYKEIEIDDEVLAQYLDDASSEEELNG